MACHRNCKFLADDTSLFSAVPLSLIAKLSKTIYQAFNWKMSFKPDPSKPAQNIIFIRKLKTVPHPSITFNNNILCPCSAQKHLGLVIGSKLTFKHIKHILSKINKSIGLLKFQPVLPRSQLLTIYKTFICSHFDYSDVTYDQSYKSLFHEKLESIQYNIAVAVTGAIRGSSTEKLYQELVLESLQSRYCFRKCCQFYKILKYKSPRHHFNIISTKLRVNNTRYCDIPLLKIKHNYFRISFFPPQQLRGIN